MKKNLIFLIYLCLAHYTQAQDPLFTQFFNNVSFSNPSLTGNSHGITLTAVHRNQWNRLNQGNIKSDFSTQYIGIEFAESCSKLAIGGYFLKDQEGAGRLKTTTGGLNLSYVIPWQNRYKRRLHNIRVGFSPYWTQKQIDWSALVFSDQLDAKEGVLAGAPTAFIPPTDGDWPTWFGFSSGLTYIGNWSKNANHSTQLSVGLGLIHLPNITKHIGPVESLLGLDTDVPFRVVALASLFMPFMQADFFGQLLNWVPQVKYERQGKIEVSTIGINAHLMPITLGIYYQNVQPWANALTNSNALSLYLGLSTPSFGKGQFIDIGISYDMNLGGVRSHIGGILELNIKYRLTQTNIACDQVICRTPGNWENVWYQNPKNKNLN